MKYAIVIPTLIDVDKPYLKLCVESLRESGFKGQIIVVMNGSRDTKPLQDGEITGISTLLNTHQQGQCGAVNLGAQYVQPDTEYIMVSNADMYYAPDWDKNLRFDDLCFSPNLIEPTNNAGSAPPFLKRDWGNDLEEFKKDRTDNGVKSALAAMQSKPNNFDDIPNKEESGFNLPFFIKRDVWLTIGGYDTKYDPWGSGSDTDLQMKVELAGIKPKRLRDVLVYHFSNKSGTFDGTHQQEWWDNWHYLENKWGFNRDEAKSDTWYCKNMILWNKLKYHPEWEGKYADIP